jgi:hypothetical protein
MVRYLCTNICINICHVLPWNFLDIPFEQALDRNNPVNGWSCWLTSLVDLRLLA